MEQEQHHEAEFGTLVPIAHIRTGFSEKFGIPRQSGLAETLTGRIVFTPQYRDPMALRGITDFSHLWLIWQFSEAVLPESGWYPTVRPPRLGGNTRVGVFATRSPFRPNRLGLSCVKLLGVENDPKEGTTLLVGGVDMLDGTPIYDIKPYIPVTDCRPDAREGYTAETKTHRLAVRIEADLPEALSVEEQKAIETILSGDPRPGYADDQDRVYGLTYNGWEIGFRVEGETAVWVRIEKARRK